MLLLMSLSFAADPPARCVASWTPPPTGCALRGNIQAQAAGPNRSAAEKATRKQLDAQIDASAAGMMAALGTTSKVDFLDCRNTVGDAFVDCFPDPALADTSLCFVTFDDAECWTGDVLNLETTGWKAVGAGRAEMCRKVDERLVAQNYDDVATRRAVCRASCETKTAVRCPSMK